MLPYSDMRYNKDTCYGKLFGNDECLKSRLCCFEKLSEIFLQTN